MGLCSFFNRIYFSYFLFFIFLLLLQIQYFLLSSTVLVIHISVCLIVLASFWPFSVFFILQLTFSYDTQVFCVISFIFFLKLSTIFVQLLLSWTLKWKPHSTITVPFMKSVTQNYVVMILVIKRNMLKVGIYLRAYVSVWMSVY